MHPLAILLVLVSAGLHVFWNYQIKRAAHPALYSWWIQVYGALLCAPIGLWLAWPVSVPAVGWYCVAGTSLFYAGYYTLIAYSYRREDLSRAYPIARGVAPAATAAWGVLFFREHPSPLGWIGIAAICLGVLALAWPMLRGGTAALPMMGILAAIGTGLCTSGYSAVDKAGVQHVQPVLYITLTFAAGAITQGALLWPGHSWRAFAREARRGGAGLLLAATAGVSGYLMILILLQHHAPVSYVVPLRSFSVLISVFVGARYLRETAGIPRFAAAALILLGIASIALARA
ncbi:MAG TPA: DMT family transporter [Chthonomonadaceae bacterium]|nr:DMT family transporter [Chthonomonadaceae bacterium]